MEVIVSSASVAQGSGSGRGGGLSVASDRGMTVSMEEALFLLSVTSGIIGDLVSSSSSRGDGDSGGKAGYAPGESKEEGLGEADGSPFVGHWDFSRSGKEARLANRRDSTLSECRRPTPTVSAKRSVGDGAGSDTELGNEPNRGERIALRRLPAEGKARVVDEPKGEERRLRVECLH